MTATQAAYFDECWSRSEDPWDHASRFYEWRKYAMTVAALPRAHYRRAFEPACGIGVLTRMIAERADSVVACDRHPRAVDVARRRCSDQSGVMIETMLLPEQWPSGRFDLIVCSEFLYYFEPTTINTIVDFFVHRLTAGGDLVAVHYRPHVPEHAVNGDEVHRRLSAHSGLERVARYEEADFVLDVFRR